MQTIETSIFNVNGNSLYTGPVNYQDFRETGPRPLADKLVITKG